MKAFTFLIFLGANFLWVLIVVGGIMAWQMKRTKNRNTIILGVSFALSMLLTLSVIERGPDDDDGMNNCHSSRMSDSC